MLQERDNEVEVDVTWEDQANINSFGRLNTRLTELREEVKSKKLPLGPLGLPQNQLEALQDANNELILADEDDPDAVTYQIGETFVQLSREALEARLAADEERISAEVRRLESDIEEIRSQMAVLKAKLYGKFKNSINLETDDA